MRSKAAEYVDNEEGAGFFFSFFPLEKECEAVVNVRLSCTSLVSLSLSLNRLRGLALLWMRRELLIPLALPAPFVCEVKETAAMGLPAEKGGVEREGGRRPLMVCSLQFRSVSPYFSFHLRQQYCLLMLRFF